jgi:putative transposase
MANTYTQLYVHGVFAVSARWNLISSQWRDELEKYISGIIRKRDSKLIQIFCMPDHVHLLMGLNPDWALSDLIRDIKADSSKWINRRHFIKGRFSWQEGYGAFSVSRSVLGNVIRYIQNQELHHGQWTFKREYSGLLKKHGLEYDERYVLEDVLNED